MRPCRLTVLFFAATFAAMVMAGCFHGFRLAHGWLLVGKGAVHFWCILPVPTG